MPRIRIQIEQGDVGSLAIRRESVLPLPDDGLLVLQLPVREERGLSRLLDAINNLLIAYAEDSDIEEEMYRLDKTYNDYCDTTESNTEA